jgi:hypothetical protein
MSSDKPSSPQLSFREIIDKSAASAMRGGIAGAAAMGANIGCLMWLRTTMNYQYRYGTSMRTALKTLYADGGIPRFYRGVLPALVQGPMSRFGDTAANTGVMTLIDSYDRARDLPVMVKTIAASTAAALFRIGLMPVDACKTTMQVEGSMAPLIAKVKANGPRVLYNGSLASASATFAGHYPWFATYNYLSATIPEQDDKLMELGRRAGIGFCSSVVSDTVSNSIRVVKVYKQAVKEQLSYPVIVRKIVAEDGIRGLMFRGLETKIFANGLQGILFSVLWKHFDTMLNKK